MFMRRLRNWVYSVVSKFSKEKEEKMVFRKAPDQPDTGFNIAALMNHKKVHKGLVGIEIELEGKRFPRDAAHDIEGISRIPASWVYHKDGSLRGEDNAEYTLKEPVAFEKVDKVLDDLWAALEKNKAVIDDSNRTSVHIHLNCQSFHLNRLTTMMAMYFTVEEILTQWCGEHRVGNLFCMMAKDAPSIITQVRRFIQDDGRRRLYDSLHYSGLNAHALVKFGSLEFRALRGVSDPAIIKQWIAILRRMYELSADYPDPRTFCDLFSGEGPLVLFDTILGGSAPAVRHAVGWSDQKIRDSMYEGIRLAQDLCYCRDWSKYKGLNIAPDPFGRSLKKVMTKLQAPANFGQPAPIIELSEWAEAPMPHWDAWTGGN